MPDGSTLRLDDQLCFALYAATNAVVRAYRPLLHDVGLTYPQYLALMVLWERDDRSVSEIAERLRLPGHALTPLLARLERLGHVSRLPDPADRRVVRVRLTRGGVELEAAAAAAQREVVCRTGLDAPSCTTSSTTCARRTPATHPPKESTVTTTTSQPAPDATAVPEQAHVPDTRRLAPESDPATAPQVQPDATLYERLGGCYGIAGAVDILVDRLFQNVKVNANATVHEHHGNPANAPGYKWLVTSWSIEAAGGPACYIGHDMSTAHEHLSIDRAGFDAVSKEIEATLDFVGVPEPELREFMDIIESYRSKVVQA